MKRIRYQRSNWHSTINAARKSAEGWGKTVWVHCTYFGWTISTQRPPHLPNDIYEVFQDGGVKTHKYEPWNNK